MSKIVKALEKAEEAQRSAEGNVGGFTVQESDLSWLDEPVGPSALAAPGARPASPVQPARPMPRTGGGERRDNVEVHYEQTKIEQACFHKMEERRLLGDSAPRELRDAFNVVRTRILQQTRAKGLNTIMVTSPGRSEGKTTVATNLAITIARDASQTALLVDANLRWPGISCGLGMDSRPGLSDHFLRGLPMESLFVNPGIDKLVVLPAGASQEDSVDIISSPRMQNLVAEMKSRYPDRYVIFDCPHLLGIPDALVFAEYVDGIVLVADEGKTAQGDLKTALAMLAGRNLLGVVLNKA
jgi:capsular exopolysaccharide synthesis family protein